VRIGVKVKLMDIDMDEEVFYTIKSDEEADFDNDEIGINSPLAQAMLGKGKGETFDFQAPRGTYQFKILAISLPEDEDRPTMQKARERSRAFFVLG
jgi:transcription elongation factor GreA